MHEEIKEIYGKAALWLAIFFLVFSVELNLSVSQETGERSFNIESADEQNPIDIKLSEEDIAITSLKINLNQAIENAQITIKSLDSITVPEPTETIYGFFKIEMQNIPIEAIETIQLSFMIEDLWLSSYGLFPSEIIIQTYNTVLGWQRIPAVYEGFSDGFRVFTADLKTSEILQEITITATRVAEIPERRTAGGIATERIVVEKITRTVRLRRPQPISFPRPTPVEEEKGLFGLLRGGFFGTSELVFAIVVILLIGGAVAVMRHFHTIHLKHEYEAIKGEVLGTKIVEEGRELAEKVLEKVGLEKTPLKEVEKEVVKQRKKEKPKKAKKIEVKEEKSRKEEIKEKAKEKKSKEKEIAKELEERKKKSKKKIKEEASREMLGKIQPYIENQLKKGHKKKEIKKSLLEKHWPKKVISFAFKKLK